jgi:Rod binding domain-containing protein
MMTGEAAIGAAGMNLAYRNPKMTGATNKEALWDTAKDFEAVFISSMLQPVFDSIDVDGPFGGGQGEKVFRSMLVQEYGQKMVETGGIGLAESVYETMLRAQEGK